MIDGILQGTDGSVGSLGHIVVVEVTERGLDGVQLGTAGGEPYKWSILSGERAQLPSYDVLAGRVVVGHDYSGCCHHR